MKSFDIYGSCVTRDIFNFLDNEIFRPINTIQSNPVSTLWGDALKIKKSDVVIDTAFVNRMIYYNLSKDVMKVLGESNSEYFILDMTCERLPIQSWNYKDVKTDVAVTWHTYRLGKKLKEIKEYNGLTINNWHLADADLHWKDNLERFSKFILSKYKADKIILVQLEQIDIVLDSDVIRAKSLTTNRNEFSTGIDKHQLREKQNQLIKQAENIFLQIVPNCWVIKMPKNVIGTATHHFKEHPLHFDYLYYEYAAEAIKLIAKDRDEGSVNKELIQKELDFLELRYSEKFLRIKQFVDKAEKISVQYYGTKDLFSTLCESNLLYYNNPICDVNLESIFSETCNLTYNECKDLFVKERVEFLNDANKTNKEILSFSNATWLIIHGKCECIPNIWLDKNGYKKIMKREGIYSILGKKQGYILEEKTINWEDKINLLNDFCQLIRNRWDESKIIVIEDYFSEIYVDKEYRLHKNKEVRRKNMYLDRYYKELYKLFPRCERIKKPKYSIDFQGDNLKFSSIDEKLYFRNAIDAIVSDNKEKIETLYVEQSYKNKMLYYGKNVLRRHLAQKD